MKVLFKLFTIIAIVGCQSTESDIHSHKHCGSGPCSITVESSFIELKDLTPQDLKELGFDWFGMVREDRLKRAKDKK